MVTPEAVPQSVRNMIQSFKSEEGAFRAHRIMMEDPDMARFARAGLAIADMDGPLNQMEENIMSPLAQTQVQGAKGVAAKAGQYYNKAFGGFNRAYNTYLNSLRFYGTKAILDTTFNGEATDSEIADVVNAVNVFTGRGSLGPFEQSAAVLNAGMFSPRYQMSRLQMLTGSPVWQSSTPNARNKILARFYGRSLLGTGMMYALYGLMFGREKDFSLTFNPLSSDFGKIRVGNIRIDPLSGLAQPIVFLNKFIRGKEITADGKTRDLRGPKAKGNRQSIVEQYLRTKLAPFPGSVVNLGLGKDVIGQPSTIGGEMLQLGVPMTWGSVANIMQDEMGVDKKIALSLLSFLGEGVAVYGDK
jgi:hypothetical protein